MDKADLLADLLLRNGITNFTREYRFHPIRKWRCDFAWLDKKVIVEVEGGTWINGRHNRGSGYIKDIEKYNEAALNGWLPIRVTPADIKTGKALELILRALNREHDGKISRS